MFFITQYPNPQAGGIENVTYRLALGLLSRGNNVSCITFGKSTELDLPFECLRITENTNENIILNFISQRNIDIIINQCIEIKWFYILKYIRLKLPNIKLIKAHHTDPLSSLKGVCDNEPLYINANDFSRLLYHYSSNLLFENGDTTILKLNIMNGGISTIQLYSYPNDSFLYLNNYQVIIAVLLRP